MHLGTRRPAILKTPVTALPAAPSAPKAVPTLAVRLKKGHRRGRLADGSANPVDVHVGARVQLCRWYGIAIPPELLGGQADIEDAVNAVEQSRCALTSPGEAA